MIGAAMMPSTVTAAPTMPVAIANTVEVRITTRIERAAHRREQHAERLEQPLHQAGLLGDEAHEDEERHRGQQLFLHQADDLEIGEVEHRRAAHSEVAECERKEQQREGDRHADEDGAQQHHEHDKPEQRFGGHTSTFSLCSSSTPVRAM